MNDQKMLMALATVSLVSMGFGVYKALRKCKDCKEEGNDFKDQEQDIAKQLQTLNNLQAVFSKKAEEIQLKYSKKAPHVLTVECLKEILELTSRIVDREQLQAIYSNNRNARRSCFKKMKQSFGEGLNTSLENYYRFVCTFEEQLQYLIEKSQKDFVVFLNIDYGTITDSIDFYTNESDSDFPEWVRLWSTQIKNQLRDQLPLNKKPISSEEILETVQYQIQSLGAQTENLKQAVRDLNLEIEDEQEAIPTFIDAFLDDLGYEKYHIEVQQMNVEAEDFTIQLKEKFHVLAELKNSVLQELLPKGFDEEEDYSDEENDE